MIVLINNILIYSETCKEHKGHLRELMKTMRCGKLYDKFKMCNF